MVARIALTSNSKVDEPVTIGISALEFKSTDRNERESGVDVEIC